MAALNRAALAIAAALAAGCGGAGATGGDAAPAADAGPAWLESARILVQGDDVIEDDCRARVCRHNENTDLATWGGAIWLVHRTAMSQVLGPNSSLRVHRTVDGGRSFELAAVIPAPADRDLRDPHFFIAGDRLAMVALTRLPVTSARDSDVDTVTVVTASADGRTWTPLQPVAPPTWSLWRVRDFAGVHYSAAYEDGDRSVRLFSSVDGLVWSAGAQIYGVAADTPLETELVFMPSGRLLALVRLDGTDEELLGNRGRLRTAVCWAPPPYAAFDCPQVLDGVRLDGPLAFFHRGRLFVLARKHFIEPADRKRTALYEIGGTLDGGPLTVRELGELPSAGDTAYAGAADLDGDRVLAVWYSGNLFHDSPWARAMLEPSDIWQGTLDLGKL